MFPTKICNCMVSTFAKGSIFTVQTFDRPSFSNVYSELRLQMDAFSMKTMKDFRLK